MNTFRKFTALSMLVVGFILMTSLLNQKGFYWSSILKEVKVPNLPNLLISGDISALTEKYSVFDSNILYGDSLGVKSDFVITKMTGNNYAMSIKLHTIPDSNNIFEFMIGNDFVQAPVPNAPRLTAWITPIILPLQIPTNDLTIENIKVKSIPWDSPMALEIVRYNDTETGIRSVKILKLIPCTDSCDFEFNDGSKYKYESTLLKCE